MAGVFFIHLISQHDRFRRNPALSLENDFTHENTITRHLQLRSWMTLGSNNRITDDDFVDNLNRWMKRTCNSNIDKFICKIVPHRYSLVAHEMEKLALFDIIVLYSERANKLYSALQREDVYIEEIQSLTPDFDMYDELASKTNIIFLCPYKILIEQNEAEYPWSATG